MDLKEHQKPWTQAIAFPAILACANPSVAWRGIARSLWSQPIHPEVLPDPNSAGFPDGACYPEPTFPGPPLYWWRNKMYIQVTTWILPCGAVCRFCLFTRTRSTAWRSCLPPLPAESLVVLLSEERGLPAASCPWGRVRMGSGPASGDRLGHASPKLLCCGWHPSYAWQHHSSQRPLQLLAQREKAAPCSSWPCRCGQQLSL